MNENSRTVNSIRNIATGFVGQFIQTILGFISRTIFIKFLATEYLGISGLFTNILSILSLAELGVGSAIIFSLYRPLAEKNEKELSVLMRFYAKSYRTIGLIIAIIGLAILPFLNIIIKDAPNINESLYLLYLIYLFNTVITYFYSYKSSIIIADQKNYIVLLVSYAVSFVQTLLQITILIATKNFIIYLAVQTIGSLVYNIIISKIANKIYPFLKTKSKDKLDNEIKKSLIKNIKALMIVKLSGVLVNNTDNMIITYFSGLATVGLASNYNMLIGIINTILLQIFGGLTASVGNLNAKESNEKKVEFFNIMNFANFWLFGFSTICIILLINDIIRVWLGNSYILPLNVTIILAVNFYMVGMQNAVTTYRYTLGLFTKGRYVLALTAFINLFLSFLLGNYFGLFGILLATALARLCTNFWYDAYVLFKYGLNKDFFKYFQRYFKYLVIMLSTLIFTNTLCNLIQINNLVILLFTKVILCITIPNLIFGLILMKTNEFKYFKSLLINLYNIKILRKLQQVVKT